MNVDNIMDALQIMWKGMVGIFVALIVIMLVVMLMSKIGSKNQKDDQTEK
ncbi:MAG: OadG family protein [Lachnospiraceae bacterium]